MSKLLTTQEAAERLRLKEQTLRMLRSRGSGPVCVYVSKTRVAYREEDIESFISGRRATSTADAAARGITTTGRSHASKAVR